MGFPTSGLFEGFTRTHSDGRRWKWRANKGVWQSKASEPTTVTGPTGPAGVAGPQGPAGSDGFIQTVTKTSPNRYYIGSGTGWENVDMSVTITPTSSSSKIMISWNTSVMINPYGNLSRIGAKIVAGSNTVHTISEHYCNENDAWRTYCESGTFIYAPNTTSATTFSLQFRTRNSGTDSSVRINEYDGYSFIQVSEIGG